VIIDGADVEFTAEVELGHATGLVQEGKCPVFAESADTHDLSQVVHVGGKRTAEFAGVADDFDLEAGYHGLGGRREQHRSGHHHTQTEPGVPHTHLLAKAAQQKGP
jgi:hypothetical protein